MLTIEFETPTLDQKGTVVARTRHIAQQFTEELAKGLRLELIVIQAGFFRMGSPDHLGNTDEHPQHFVTVNSFMMGKFLITQAQWKAVMGTLPPCRFKGENLPVERVSWDEAQRFCQRLSKRTRRDYRLPSEAQWEYACRAGMSTPFSFGETITVDVANFNGEHTFREEPRGSYFHATSEGGRFPPNAFGLYDTHGNLWEWCADSWQDDYSDIPRGDQPLRDKRTNERVARGGSWHEPPGLCRSAARMKFLRSDAEEVIGLRVVCDPIDQGGL